MDVKGFSAQLLPGLGVHLRALVPDAHEPRVLLIHDLAGGAEDIMARAANPAAIAYDRRGYGGSTAPEPYGATSVEEQAEDAAQLLDALQAPPLTVAGEGFGAVIALGLARQHPQRVKDLVLMDPVMLQLLPDGAEWLSVTRAELETALQQGPQAAVAHYTQRDDNAINPRAFFADFAVLPSYAITRRELRQIAPPARIVTSAQASPRAVASAAGLAEIRGVTVEQAELAEALA